MCGGCGGGPPDEHASLVQGPRRRREIATRVSAILPRAAVTPTTAGWGVRGVTGGATVCRTFDDLVHAVGRISDLSAAEIRSVGLGDTAHGRDGRGSQVPLLP